MKVLDAWKALAELVGGTIERLEPICYVDNIDTDTQVGAAPPRCADLHSASAIGEDGSFLRSLCDAFAESLVAAAAGHAGVGAVEPRAPPRVRRLPRHGAGQVHRHHHRPQGCDVQLRR